MSRLLAALLLAACAALFLPPGPVGAQQAGPPSEDCAEIYDRAQHQYYESNFARATALAEACLDEGALSPDLRVRFLRLLVLAHLERGATAEARQAAAGLLETRPAYAPDPVEDPPAYAQFIREVKAEREDVPQEAASDGRGWVTWALAGAGTVVTGVIAAVLLGGGGDDEGGGGQPKPLPPLP